jgi:VWA domain-containing protein/HEAT repeat protein
VRRVGLSLVVIAAAFARTAAATDDPDPLAKLRSADATVRLDGLAWLAGQPVSYLTPRRASLHAILPRMLAKDPSPAVRGSAARALARVEGDDAIAPLVAAISNERDAEAERRLPQAFEELKSDAARRALAQAALDASDPRRAALAAEALGFLPKGAGFDDLAALLDSAPNWAVASGACLGMGRVVDVRVVPVLLQRLRHPDPAVRSAARESLVRLTGEDCGTDPVKWENWWAGAKDGFKFPDKAPDLPAMRRGGTADHPMGDGDATFARFFGVELRRRRVAFLIDFSQSMWGARRAKAEEELVAAVKGLPSTNSFAVVLFNEKVWWFKDGPLPARPQEKLDLARYLAEQETKSYTNIYDALEAALGLAGLGLAARVPAPGLDEIVLLSDGWPNRGRITDPAKILEAVRSLNGGRVIIDAVALGDGPGELLPKLAKENGGKFVSCPFAK